MSEFKKYEPGTIPHIEVELSFNYETLYMSKKLGATAALAASYAAMAEYTGKSIAGLMEIMHETYQDTMASIQDG